MDALQTGGLGVPCTVAGPAARVVQVPVHFSNEAKHENDAGQAPG